METSSILIRRCVAQYILSAEPERAWRIKARLDETISRDLSSAIAETFKPIVSDSDPSVWLIRRLEVALDASNSWDPDVLARVWAGEIANSQAAAMRGSTESGNVVRFPNRASYLAAFLLDASRDDAWSKWYFKEFDGLRMLPRSAAMRTAICEEPVVGFAALTTLDASHLPQVLRSMTTRDASQVTTAISSSDSKANAESCMHAISEMWQATLPHEISASREVHQSLSLYIQIVAAQPVLAGLVLRQLIEAVVRLVRCCLETTSTHRDVLLNSVSRGDLATLYREAGTADATVIAPLQNTPLPILEYLVGNSQSATEERADEIAISAPRETNTGEVFLLLPLLDELPIDKTAVDWPGIDGVSASSLVRFLLMLKCCGPLKRKSAATDPLLRELFCVPPDLTFSTISDWLRRIRKDRIGSLIVATLNWRVGKGSVDGRNLVVNRLPTRGEPAAIIIDASRGVWLSLTGCQSDRSVYFRTSIERLVKRFQPERVICHKQLRHMIRGSVADEVVVNVGDKSINPEEMKESAVRDSLLRLDRACDDERHLSLRGSMSIALDVDRSLSVLAQGLLRDFAWRLPGYAHSNLEYLHRNFLDVTASLEDEPGRRVVRMGRPPLDLILSVTGMARKTYLVSWLDNRPFVLFQAS